jgi:hypothetical protein
VTTQCGSCGASVGDGGRLCTGCTDSVARLLLTAANIAADLDDAVAKQLTRGTGGRRSEAEVPLPVDLAASDVRGELLSELRSWMHAVMIASGQRFSCDDAPAYELAAMAPWLIARLDVIRQHPRAGETVRIRAKVNRALAVIDRKPERLYAGPCPRCGTDLLGQPGASVITCPCGTVHEVSERQYVMGEALWDTLGTVPWIVTAASALGVRLSEHTVRTWVKRGKLARHGERPAAFGGTPQAVYRFGDAMKLAAERPGRHAQASVAP